MKTCMALMLLMGAVLFGALAYSVNHYGLPPSWGYTQRDAEVLGMILWACGVTGIAGFGIIIR